MTPDQTVIEHLLTSLEGITTANGYSANVRTVDVKDRQMRDFNDTDTPLILLSIGIDEFDRESFGAQSGNVFFRFIDIDIYLRFIDESGVEPIGSDFKWDVIKCLLANRCADDGKLPWDLIIGAMNPNEFERSENRKAAEFRIPVRVKYQFALSDL